MRDDKVFYLILVAILGIIILGGNSIMKGALLDWPVVPTGLLKSRYRMLLDRHIERSIEESFTGIVRRLSEDSSFNLTFCEKPRPVGSVNILEEIRRETYKVTEAVKFKCYGLPTRPKFNKATYRPPSCVAASQVVIVQQLAKNHD